MDGLKNLRPFQIGLLAFFTILGVVSVIILAGFDVVSKLEVNPYGDQVVIWGTFDEKTLYNILNEVEKGDKDFSVVRYVEKDPRTFKEELVNAIAEGRSPDAIILAHEDLVVLRTKLQAIPYATIPERTFKDNYLDGFEIFARTDGIYAIPLGVDPLVMYWNRDILAAVGLAEPPVSWEALVNNVAPKVTIRDARRNIVQSTVAFGEYSNVVHAKELLSTLIMQSGSRMVEETSQGYTVALDAPIVESSRKPMEAAVQFYLDFSNPNSALYSWNRTQPNDLVAFIGEDLALYFGSGSERSRIRELNPNFNFDMAMMPQGATATTKRSYGDFYGLAIMQASSNKQGTYAALRTLASQAAADAVTSELGLAPALRASVSAGTSDPYRQVVFNQALIARGWLEPSPEETDPIWRQMIEDVVSNRLKVNGAVSDAIKRLELAY